MQIVVATLCFAVALVVCTAEALPVDSIVWRTLLNDYNPAAPPNQFIATSPNGNIIVLGATNVVSLHPLTGDLIWTSQMEGLDASYMAFAVSSTAVVVANNTTIYSLNISDGRVMATAQLSSGVNPGISNVASYKEFFVVSGGTSLAIYRDDLTELYSPTMTNQLTVGNIGFGGDYCYFTLADDSTSGTLSGYLMIVNLVTLEATRVEDVGTISSTDVNGHIAVLGFDDMVLSCVNLATGAFVWRNKEIAKKLNNFGSFTLLFTSDVLVVVADGSAFGFDAAGGSLVFEFMSAFNVIASATVASGRLVYVGEPAYQYSVPSVAALDVSTGQPLGVPLPAPTLESPVMIAVGNNVIMLHGQGYTRVNLNTMTVAAYNMKLPGLATITTLQLSGNSTTFLVAGLVGAAAFTLADE